MTLDNSIAGQDEYSSSHSPPNDGKQDARMKEPREAEGDAALDSELEDLESWLYSGSVKIID